MNNVQSPERAESPAGRASLGKPGGPLSARPKAPPPAAGLPIKVEIWAPGLGATSAVLVATSLLIAVTHSTPRLQRVVTGTGMQ